MSRTEALVGLYRLALSPPSEGHVEPFAAWLRERQSLLDLARAPGDPLPGDAAIVRALGALILHADAETQGRLFTRRRQLVVMLNRRGGYGRDGGHR
jgi:hypothetical protein